ncbi:MAG: polynucleotide adenylyltransferase, partial [Bacillota bacterium]
LLRSWGFAQPGEQWLNYILAVTYLLSIEDAGKLCAKYHLNKRQTEKVTKTVLHWREIIARLREGEEEKLGPEDAGVLARLLLTVPREAYPLLLALLTGPREQERFRRVLALVRDSRPRVDGEFIKSLGYRPGPVFREALDAVWQARLEGRLATKEAEMEFVKEYLRQKAVSDA